MKANEVCSQSLFSYLQSGMPRLNSRSQAVLNTVRMETKITQTNPQSSDLRLQTTGLELLVKLKSEFLHPHGDKPSDTNVGSQLGLDPSSSRISLKFQSVILSEVSLLQTQLLSEGSQVQLGSRDCSTSLQQTCSCSKS